MLVQCDGADGPLGEGARVEGARAGEQVLVYIVGDRGV